MLFYILLIFCLACKIVVCGYTYIKVITFLLVNTLFVLQNVIFYRFFTRIDFVF